MRTRRPRLFTLLLQAFPESFRRRFGEAMRADFEAAWAEHESRPGRLIGFLLRTSTDMLWAGLKERLRPTSAPGQTHGNPNAWTGARFSTLDLKLGLRMLAKQPGLTCVTVFALAIGIPVGLAPTHFSNALEAPLPVPDGDRLRLLRYWNPLTSRPEATTLEDFKHWDARLTTFGALGAARGSAYNLGTGNGFAPPVSGAEVTASTFDILRVPPLLGRALSAGDEHPGAPRVAVIGFDLWQSRFAGEAQVVGADLRIGGIPHTIVGVMPREFRFPINEQIWLPLRERPAVGPEGDVPLTIFGRLAKSSTDDAAQAQLSALGRHTPAAFRPEPATVQPELMPYSYWSARVLGGPKGGLKATPEYLIAQTVSLGLLLVACVNVSMLIFARTTSRSSELSVRTALGASRSRIIAQIFTESLVLAVGAASLGLMLLNWLPSWLIAVAIEGQTPFPVDLGVSLQTILWTLVLAVFSAGIVGIIPAFAATGPSVQGNIQGARMSRSGGRFGGLSSVLIVADVAIAVAAVGLAAGLSYQLGESWTDREATGIEAAQFLSAELRFPGTDRKDEPAHTAARQKALVERIEAEPGVLGVAMARVLPRMDHPSRFVEVEGRKRAVGGEATRVRTASVDLNFFRALEKPILNGRGFDVNDLREDSSTVIVNTTFVKTVFEGRNAIGKRIRYRTRSGEGEPGPWLEIVGVVGHLGMRVLNPDLDEGVYHPLAPGTQPVFVAVHLAATEPESFIPRLRALAGEVDPTISIGAPVALNKVHEGDWYLMGALTLGGGVLIALLLALAASGIYAIMSFAVTERTREIGIRAALGASRSDIVLTVARRSLGQLALGALIGTPVAARIVFEILRDAGLDTSTFLVVAAALAPGIAVMILVGLVACTAPTLRALRVTPTEALRV